MKEKIFVALYASALLFILCTAFYSLCQSIINLLDRNIIGLVWLISAVFFGVLGWEMTNV